MLMDLFRRTLLGAALALSPLFSTVADAQAVNAARTFSAERIAQAKEMNSWLPGGQLPYAMQVATENARQTAPKGFRPQPLAPFRAGSTTDPTITAYLISHLDGTEPSNAYVCSFPASANTKVTELGYLGLYMIGSYMGGEFFDDGDKYAIIEGLSMFGINMFTYYEFETKDWTLLRSETLSDYSLFSTETAYDPVTDKTYGCFYDAKASGMEFGQVSYASMKRTKIGSLSQPIMAMGATSKGEIYGVALDGNLYKINKTTGELTLVGPTGVAVASSYQSADIDHATDVFYWAAVDTAKTTALYTVDLTTGAATKVVDYPNRWQWGSMNIFHAPADGAPAKPQNVSYDFGQGLTKGTFTFTAPTKTMKGDALGSTNLTYYVEIDDSVYEQGTATPGQTITTKQLELATGNRYVRIYLHNDAGWGEKHKQSYFIGLDRPKPVSGLTVKPDNDKYSVDVSWTAPTEGVYGGYIDISKVKYDVLRNDSLIATTTGTSLTDVIGQKPYDAYKYKVSPRTDAVCGDTLQSEIVRMGTPLPLPYEQSFDNSSDVDIFTIIDANKDGHTWEWGFYDDHDEFKTLKYHGAYFYTTTWREPDDSLKDADDWAFTPPIEFDSTYSYRITFDAFTQYSDYTQKLEVKFGDAQTVEAMNQTVIEEQEVTGTTSKKTTYTALVTVPKNGVYHFGFHCTSSKKYAYYLHVDNIKIEQGSTDVIADSVTNLTVGGNKGEAHATVRFTAPTKSIAGKELQSIARIDVRRIAREGMYGTKTDTLTIKTLDNVRPGESFTVEDTMKTALDSLMFRTNFGSYYGYGGNKITYDVVPYVGQTAGTANSATAFIGADAPLPPASVRGEQTSQSSALISWDAVTDTVGYNGGWVDPSQLTYTVYKSNSSGILADSVKGLSATVELPTTGKQQFYNIGVATRTPSLRGVTYAKGPWFLVGEPLKVTAEDGFSESFTNRKVTNASGFFGVVGSRMSIQKLRDRTQTTSTKKGVLRYNVSTTTEKNYKGQSLGVFPRMNFTALANPELSFYVMGYPGDTIYVEAVTPEGTDTLGMVTEYIAHTSGKWTLAEPNTFSLKKYAGQSNIYLQLDFRGTATQVYVDDIAITENTTGIQTVDAGGSGGFGQGAAFDVYTTDGRCVARQLTGTASLPDGIYILRSGTKVGKIAVSNR